MTAPLTPPDCDLRGYEYMPLYGDRLFKSETWIAATPEAKIACLRLWWHAYAHEVPAASLPDNDVLLAEYAGYGVGVRQWTKVRAQVMRGFVKCDDGRWYHETLASIALEGWIERLGSRKRQAAYRERKAARNAESNAHDNGNGGDNATRNVTVTLPLGNAPERKGTERKQKPKTADFVGLPGFERFWQAWPAHPRKVDKRNCESRWRSEGCEAIADRIVADVEARKRSPDWTKHAGEFIPGPAVYLNQRRWEAPVALPSTAPAERKVAL